MESLRDIRQNIKAIKSTQQIMQTMKMISNARIRKAQDLMTAARPFANKMLEMVDDLKQDVLALPQPEDGSERATRQTNLRVRYRKKRARLFCPP